MLRSPTALRWLFLLTILTGSFLLFLIQPMVARMAMPRLGGASAVWISAQLVYQALLLAGYAYSHGLARLTPRRQAMIHLALFAIAALWLPVGLIAAQPPQGSGVVLFVPWLLAASIGPLFLAVAAQAPLMQRWYAQVAPGEDPYWLYAASNIGSFAGLIAYPLLVEPLVGSHMQSALWTGLYVALFLLVIACAWSIRESDHPVPVAADSHDHPVPQARPGARDWAWWLALSAVPSGLMLSTTAHLTTDLAAMPLLWAIPLGLYLLSFSIAFATRRAPANIVAAISPYVLILLGGGALAASSRTLLAFLPSLALLFVVASALHTRLYDSRPAPRHLTGFYLAMSIGGALGGLFCAIIAPLLFDWVYEHPLLLLAAAFLVPVGRLFPRDPSPRLQRIATGIAALVLVVVFSHLSGWMEWSLDAETWLAVLLGIGVLLAFSRTALILMLFAALLAGGLWDKLHHGSDRIRSYYGVYTVYDAGDERRLLNGTTLHGMQFRDPQRATQPTSYYGPQSGVGQILNRAAGDARIGIIGLGTGTLACYHQPGQRWTFFEIDPVDYEIARDPARFTYLSRCAPAALVEIGDARLSLGRMGHGDYDVIVVDAFSSDAIPLHLLTREAFDIYRRALKPGGVLIVHITNRYFELEPVLAAEAQGSAMAAARLTDYQESGGLATSVWIAMSRDATHLAAIAPADDGWKPLSADPGFERWTDDFGSVLPLLTIWRK